MNLWIRSALTIAVLLLGYDLMVEAFHRMNLPSTPSFFGGGAIIVALVLGVPPLLYLIWRREQ